MVRDQFVYVADEEGLKQYTRDGGLFNKQLLGECYAVVRGDEGQVYAAFGNGDNAAIYRFDENLNEQWSMPDVRREVNALTYVPSVDSVYYGTTTRFSNAYVGRVDGSDGTKYGELEMPDLVYDMSWDNRGNLWVSTDISSDSLRNLFRVGYEGLIERSFYVQSSAGSSSNDPVTGVRFDNEKQQLFLTDFSGTIRKFTAPNTDESFTEQWASNGTYPTDVGQSTPSQIDKSRAYYHAYTDASGTPGVVKLNQSGSLGWQYDAANSIGSVAVAFDGAVFITTANTIQGEEKVIKLTLNGNEDTSWEVANSVYDIAVTPEFESDPYYWRSGNDNPQYIHYNRNKELVQLNDSGSINGTVGGSFRDIDVDRDGVIYANEAATDEFVAYDNDLNLLWSYGVIENTGGSSHSEDGRMLGAGIDSSSNSITRVLNERDGFQEREHLVESSNAGFQDVVAARDGGYYAAINNRVEKRDIDGDVLWTYDFGITVRGLKATHEGQQEETDDGASIDTAPRVFVYGNSYSDSQPGLSILRDYGTDYLEDKNEYENKHVNYVGVGRWEENAFEPTYTAQIGTGGEKYTYDKDNAYLVTHVEEDTIKKYDEFGTLRSTFQSSENLYGVSGPILFPSPSGHEEFWINTYSDSTILDTDLTVLPANSDIPTVTETDTVSIASQMLVAKGYVEQLSSSTLIQPSTQMLITETLLQGDTISQDNVVAVTTQGGSVFATADTAAPLVEPDAFINITVGDSTLNTFTVPLGPVTSTVTTTESLKEMLSVSQLPSAQSSIIATVSEEGITAMSISTDVAGTINNTRSITESFTESDDIVRPVNTKPSMIIAESLTQGVFQDVATTVYANETGKASTAATLLNILAANPDTTALPANFEPSETVYIDASLTDISERLDIQTEGSAAIASATITDSSSLREADTISALVVSDSEPRVTKALRESILDATTVEIDSRLTRVFNSDIGAAVEERRVQTFGDFNQFADNDY